MEAGDDIRQYMLKLLVEKLEKLDSVLVGIPDQIALLDERVSELEKKHATRENP